MARKKAEKKAEKIARGITDKIECNTVDIDDWAEFWGFTREEYEKFLETAIKTFDQESVIDKIRTEILEEKECAYADFEQYKVEYLGVDAEYAEDELPQDDFRYGMERAVEIIDKYKVEG